MHCAPLRALAGIGALVRNREEWPHDAPARAGLRAPACARYEQLPSPPGADGVLLADPHEVVDTVDGLTALVGWREAGAEAGLTSS